jgi:hypothetical protein
MKYSKKTCVHAKVVVALNAENYLKYETSANGNLIEYVCVRFHDRKEFNFFEVPRKFKFYRGGYARVVSLEKLVLKENQT